MYTVARMCANNCIFAHYTFNNPTLYKPYTYADSSK
jgi:hypothetical protein